MDAAEIFVTVRERGVALGLDLAAGFALDDWHRIRRVGDPELGRAGSFGVVIGNTRALWERLATLDLAEHDPIDDWVARCLPRLIEGLPSLGVAYATGEEPAPVVRLAELAGLVEISPVRLALHPVHGLWIALRAVLIFDASPAGFRRADRAQATSRCASCGAPCVVARARCPEATSFEELRTSWRDFLAVRDACPVGRASRYGDAQIRYHYAGEGRPGRTDPPR